jgi:hypothetical protein
MGSTQKARSNDQEEKLSMKAKLFGTLLIVVMLVGAMVPAAVAAPQQASSSTRQIPAGGTTRIRANAPAVAGAPSKDQPEFRPGSEGSDQGGDGAGSVDRPRPEFKWKHGIFPRRPLDAPKVKSSKVANSNPELTLSFAGMNHFDQRFGSSAGNNQWSLEPPDQGLCVGNGYVLETINSVIRVWDTNGNALTGVGDLNTFFGYPFAVNRTTGVIGPDVIDPQCYYDPDNSRFIVDITTLLVDENGNYNGKNSIDVAVSNTGDPTGTWTIYHVPAQNDGTDGTPNHGCTLDGTTPGPCFQDYPHIGGDKYGVYISTNEYDLFGPSYNAAQVFAFSKNELAAHPASINVTLVENLKLAGTPGWTVWPAISPAGRGSRDANGTEYFLSTIAGDGSETGNPTGTARYIGLWALTNTQSLNSGSPALRMQSEVIRSETYVVPPKSDQKVGDVPMADCLNDTSALFGTDPTYGNLGCWYIFLDPPPTWQPEVETNIDSNDSRMQQVWYTDGMLWGSTDTAVNVNKEIKAGIAWFAVDPGMDRRGQLDGKVKKQGYLALAKNNLTYPAIAMGTNGKGVIAFTVLGQDYYPSAGYVTIDDKGRVGPIHIAAPGLGPDDGFTGYKGFQYFRPRWGDYGAAVTDGSNIWIASEYIGQTCDYETWLYGDLTCNSTRTAYANWGTYISKIHP